MIAKPQILVVDDDCRLLEALTIFLDKNGYGVSVATDGREGLQCFFQFQPDLVVLDIMMPVMDGWELCARIREVSDTPVIMLTARGQEYDRVKGLSMGADDYLVKPFGLRELEARIEAVLRRSHPAPQEAAHAASDAVAYSDGTLTVDSTHWLVLRNQASVALTATERRLLFFLVKNAGQIVPTPLILRAIWGPAYQDESDYVKLYIWRLRQKIEADPEHPEYLITERGVGYRFAGKKA